MRICAWRAENVKRGILQSGGFPIELPAISLSETFVKPSAMMYRNFLAMETEELLRSHPIDGAVLMGGCDKTTPGLVMGAISMGLPAIYIPAGPMLRGNWNGNFLGSGSDVWKYWTEKRAGNITEADWNEIEGGIARSFGTCMVMGTAATMMAIAEALGLSLPGASSIPAADSNHPRMCTNTGRRIVDMVWEDLTPSKILTPAAFDNAIKVHMAMGGSTNAIIHVVAMARRAGVPVDMERFDQISRQVPVLANVRPSGKYLMEDFFYAGGLRAMMQNLREKLDLTCLTVTGKTVGENIEGAKVHLPEVIHLAQRSDLCRGRDGRAQGQSCAQWLRHQAGRRRQALPQASRQGHRLRELRPHDARDRARTISTSRPTIFSCSRARVPKAAPACPNGACCRFPKRLLGQGVRDMIRISDGRMSGTSYGACILHVAPEKLRRRAAGSGADRRRDRDRRRQALDPSARQRRGIGAAQGEVDPAAAEISARLRRALHRPYRAGRPGLRFRFPGSDWLDTGAGDTLAWRAQSVPSPLVGEG